MRNLVDLHVHTTASDGTMSPEELVHYAHKKGVAVVGITDHDTTAGISEAQKAGDLLGVEVIPGIEVSVEYEGEMHILGYFIKDTQELKDKMVELRAKREERNRKIIRKLNDCGVNISWDEVMEAAKGETIGRPHIGMVMVQKGYARALDSCFEKYLGKGKTAYVDREKMGPREGIELIIQAGGVPVLAHPRYLNMEMRKLDALLSKLKDEGLEGIEAYYSMNTQDETGKYLRLAVRHGLAVTGGTDFHGTNKPDVDIGTGRGNMALGPEMVVELKKRRK